MQSFVFLMAVLLVEGKKLALAPWSLGAFYARLNKYSKNITRSVGRYDVVSYVDDNFLQLFLWERFLAISPMNRGFKIVTLQLVDGMERIKMSLLNLEGEGGTGLLCPRNQGNLCGR